MTTGQINAFKNSTSGIPPSSLLAVITAVLAVIFLLWLAWIAYSQFRLWQIGKGDFYDVIFSTASAAVVVLLVGYLIR